MARVDPLALDPEGVSLHQLATFAAGSELLAEAVAHSPLFTLRREGSVARAEWIATAPEEPLPYPLGRVTLHERGLLLEAFAESRITEMRRQLDGLGSLRISADETCAFRLEELLREPTRALHPAGKGGPGAPTVLDVARWYLRAGWTYQPCADLEDRPPYVVAQTGRGQKRIAGLIDGLPAKLRARYRDFPTLDLKDLRTLLLPVPAPAPPPEAPRPRVSRAPRRS